MATPRRYRNPVDGRWHVQVTQGDTYVTQNPEETIVTILGSCVAACIRDPIAGVGGMNHFLLPQGTGADRDTMRYGVNAMELLINGLLKRGGCRQNFEAKLFGGANVISALSDIGTRNAEFAERFLADEGIAVIGGHLRGRSARRIQYVPLTGRARQIEISGDQSKLVREELTVAKSDIVAPSSNNDVELF